MKKVLVVVDMQRDFITGALGTKEAQAIVPNVKKKIEEYRARGDKIIFTRDTHFDDYLTSLEGKHLPVKHCIFETHGWQIADEVAPIKGETVINKTQFGEPTLFYTIPINSEAVEFCGLCTDICLISNILMLKSFPTEYEITVDAKCCAGVTPEKHKAALEVMKSCQVNVINED